MTEKHKTQTREVLVGVLVFLYIALIVIVMSSKNKDKAEPEVPVYICIENNGNIHYTNNVVSFVKEASIRKTIVDCKLNEVTS